MPDSRRASACWSVQSDDQCGICLHAQPGLVAWLKENEKDCD